MTDWVDMYLDKAIQKIKVENEHLKGGTPYIPYDGRYTDVMTERGIDWWTNGFWSGILWQLFNYTKEKNFKESAIIQEKRLDRALYEFKDIHHDVGFIWLLTSVAHYKLTKNTQAYRTGIHAANLLAGRYNIDGHFLVAWNDHPGWVIIDSMMNIQLLYWASAETKDPRFEKIASQHANTVAKYLVREDGSVGHIASFNENTGEFIEQLAGQGVQPNSAWSRGNAWGIYGFALAYRHTKNPTYLKMAQLIADYFISEIRKTNFIPVVDFRAPIVPELHDTSAGLIAACGLLEIAKWCPERKRQYFKKISKDILVAVEKKYADWSFDEDGIIGGGTEAYHRPATYEVPLIYSDYFFVEALLQLKGKAAFLW
ncbi:glycoside hydrolase family 88 protein [Agrilactobacillus yilanensis]|uniref:Glycoside hydrolase family 88 protein n=1 Tax=Agrilactobacillus yilanensis TaxID=2485997 RepID=A0ABW4J2Y9_9LACO|nr:glycoside hydrolase family 88 protein [Agrilactobacillus yilanensis]